MFLFSFMFHVHVGHDWMVKQAWHQNKDLKYPSTNGNPKNQDGI